MSATTLKERVFYKIIEIIEKEYNRDMADTEAAFSGNEDETIAAVLFLAGVDFIKAKKLDDESIGRLTRYLSLHYSLGKDYRLNPVMHMLDDIKRNMDAAIADYGEVSKIADRIKAVADRCKQNAENSAQSINDILSDSGFH